MFECIIDEAIRSIRDRERRGEDEMKERQRMKQEEDRMEKRKYSSSMFLMVEVFKNVHWETFEAAGAV